MVIAPLSVTGGAVFPGAAAAGAAPGAGPGPAKVRPTWFCHKNVIRVVRHSPSPRQACRYTVRWGGSGKAKEPYESMRNLQTIQRLILPQGTAGSLTGPFGPSPT